MKKEILLSCILVILIIILGIGGIWTYKWFTAPIRGQIEKREMVQGKDYRMYSYDHFYDLHASYESYKDTLKTQINNLDLAESSSERSRIRQNIAAIKSQMARVREEYNNDSRKEETVGKFKGWDLPKRLEVYNVN